MIDEVDGSETSESDELNGKITVLRKEMSADGGCTESCRIHKDEVIKYFCKIHNKLGCHACVMLDHKTCECIYIPENYSHFGQRLVDMKKLVKEECTKSNENATKVEELRTDAFDQIKTFRKRVNNFFDRLENDLVLKAGKKRDNDLKAMADVSENCKRTEKCIEKLISDLDTLSRSRKYSQLFRALADAEIQVMTLETSIEQIRQKNEITKYLFKPEEKILDLMDDPCPFGELSTVKYMENIKVSYSEELNVVSPTDSAMCSTAGLVPLSGGQLVFTDYNNKKIKLIDTNHNVLLSELSTSSFPWGISKVATDEVAVTLPDEDKIVFVSVSNGALSKRREVKTKAGYYGIVHDNVHCTLITRHDGAVLTMNMKGNILKREGSIRRYFSDKTKTKYLGANTARKVLYVTKCDNHTVEILDMNGRTMTRYKDPSLIHPTGVAVDDDGLVYVCGRTSSNIHQFTPDGALVQVLLHGQENQLDSPQCLAYSKINRKMYIGQWNSRKIKVFQIE